MRYLNWDVLLFPGSSRVPLQEFDTKCHVVSDPNSRPVDNAALNSNSYLSETSSMSQIPILTCFVSSLESGTPFRVSIHSWESPKASHILRTFKTTEELVAYEARVYVDGIMVAHRVYSDQVVWPEVIEFTGSADTTYSKPISFPAFHPEILHQAHWEPGESYGRIRVVIAEGVTGRAPNGSNDTLFDRLRDVVGFSFQHAPRHVLQHSGIAWPNPQMFRQAPRALQRNIASRVSAVPDLESHAHSPQRHPKYVSATQLFGTMTPKDFAYDDRSTEITAIDDPFIVPVPTTACSKPSQMRLKQKDDAARDYNSVRTVRSHAGTEMSGISYAKPDFERAMNEAAIDEIVEALSPERKRDLLEALDVDRKDVHEATQAVLKPEFSATTGDKNAEELGPQSTTIPLLLTFDDARRRSAYCRSTYVSRYASAPTLSPSTTVCGKGLRNFLDPVLPCDLEDLPSQPRSFVEHRTRSSSNSSKRKRQESPDDQPATVAYDLASMLTSPDKGAAAIPTQAAREGDAGGATPLSKQK